MDIGDIKYLEVPAKVMKLSDAARIGWTKYPRLIGVRMKFHDEGRVCFLKAAAIGRGQDITGNVLGVLPDHSSATCAYANRFGSNFHDDVAESVLSDEDILNRFAEIGY